MFVASTIAKRMVWPVRPLAETLLTYEQPLVLPKVIDRSQELFLSIGERRNFLAVNQTTKVKGHRCRAGIHNLRQPVLEVPGEAAALGICEGIAVCVVDVFEVFRDSLLTLTRDDGLQEWLRFPRCLQGESPECASAKEPCVPRRRTSTLSIPTLCTPRLKALERRNS